MAKRNKLNTRDLIRQMMEKKDTTVHVLEDLKNERVLDPMVDKQHFKAGNVRERTVQRTEKKESLSRPKNTDRKNGVNSTKLDRLLKPKKQKDKTGSFMFTLNRDILVKYEKLAVGISYKLDSKVSRNQLMRKVLEDFIHKNYTELKKEIDQKSTT